MTDQTERAALGQALTTLASTPDDASAVGDCFERIVRLVAAQVPAVDYASVTPKRDQASTTVAMSNALALAVDEAQYAEDLGPCLQAMYTGRPVAADDIVMTVSWPQFRQEAVRLGLRSSLSIPLWAARGRPIAALNLYARQPDALKSLAGAIDVAFDNVPGTPAMVGLDDGNARLVDGFRDAMAVQRNIHVGIGILMARHGTNADDAYLLLRARAADAGLSVPEAVKALQDVPA